MLPSGVGSRVSKGISETPCFSSLLSFTCVDTALGFSENELLWRRARGKS